MKDCDCVFCYFSVYFPLLKMYKDSLAYVFPFGDVYERSRKWHKRLEVFASVAQASIFRCLYELENSE